MRLVHCADLHIGHRRFDRMTSTGINQREADVAKTLTVLIDRCIALRPDVIVVAGDIFDSPRPSNHAIVHMFTQWSRLRTALPSTVIVWVLGNHDVPKGPSSGSIFGLFASLKIEIAHRSMQFTYPDRDLSILAVPDVAGLKRPPLVPDKAFRFNVLVLHGEVEGMPRKGGDTKHEIASDEVGADAWDYVALGHYHCHRMLAPNMAYSGSIDYVSSDVWGELREEAEAGQTGKVFVERDLVTGEHRTHALPVSRAFVDLPAIDATGLGCADLDAAIAERVAGINLDRSCVRLIVENVTRDVERGLEAKAQREYKARAVSWKLDCRRADPMQRIREVTTERKKQLASPTFLRDMLAERMSRIAQRQDFPADVDPVALQATALELFDRATELHREKGAVEGENDSLLERQLQSSIDHTPVKRIA